MPVPLQERLTDTETAKHSQASSCLWVSLGLLPPELAQDPADT